MLTFPRLVLIEFGKPEYMILAVRNPHKPPLDSPVLVSWRSWKVDKNHAGFVIYSLVVKSIRPLMPCKITNGAAVFWDDFENQFGKESKQHGKW